MTILLVCKLLQSSASRLVHPLELGWLSKAERQSLAFLFLLAVVQVFFSSESILIDRLYRNFKTILYRF